MKIMVKTSIVVTATSLLLLGCVGIEPNSILDSARSTYERVSSNPVVIENSTKDLNVAKRKLDSAIAAWKGKKSKSEIDKLAYIAEQYALIAEQRSTLLRHQTSIDDGKLMRNNVQMELRASEAEPEALATQPKYYEECEINDSTGKSRSEIKEKALRTTRELEELACVR